MKKLIFMLSAVFFLFAACEKEVDSTDPASATPESGFHKANPYTGDECAETFSTPMIAGGGKYDENCTGIEVGTITVLKGVNAEGKCTYDVTYDITETGWVIDVTHLYVGLENDMPVTKKGNPKIGHFTTLVHPGGTEDPIHYPQIIAESCNTADDYIIAAHADVRYGDPDPLPYTLEVFCEVLPGEVTINVSTNFDNSYMNIEVIDDDWLDGTWPGWCIDVDEPIEAKDSPFYNTAVYCLDEADDIVDNHGNLHMVAWLINQHYVHTPSGCEENANYTYADVQYAIWLLVDYNVPDPDDVDHLGAIFVEDLDICRALEIVDDAVDYTTENDPFEPGCGESTVVVLDPGEGIQKLILEFPLECDQEETAWGFGYNSANVGPCHANDVFFDINGKRIIAIGTSFSGSSWGWYFYGCQDPVPASE